MAETIELSADLVREIEEIVNMAVGMASVHAAHMRGDIIDTAGRLADEINSQSRHALVYDNQDFWFVVPEDRMDEWRDWLQAQTEDSESFEATQPPDFAVMVDGPYAVRFGGYTIATRANVVASE